MRPPIRWRARHAVSLIETSKEMKTMFEVLKRQHVDIMRPHAPQLWEPVTPRKTYADPGMAKEAARAVANATGYVHKIGKVTETANTSWHAREVKRFALGVYELPKWDREDLDLLNRYPFHFTHLSEKRDGRLAFTENDDKGNADSQTPMLVGRYLSKFHGDLLSPEKIAALSSLCGDTGFEVILETADIVTAYINGPRSCMSKTADSFYTDIHHPVEIYGGKSDLALAILRRDGAITARAVCWPARKTYGRIYGDDVRLKSELARRGWKSGYFQSAKLNRIPIKGTFVCAYLDGEQMVRDNGEFLIIDSDGEHVADSETGLLSDYANICQGCDGSIHEENVYRSEDGAGPYCEECYHERYTSCEDCGVEAWSEDTVYIDCENMTVCDTCADSDFFRCENCSEMFRVDDAHYSDDGVDGPYCEDCLPDDETETETKTETKSEGVSI